MNDLSDFAAWITYDSKNGDFMLHPSETVGIISYEDKDYYFETDQPLKIKHGMSVELGYNIIELHLHPPSQLGLKILTLKFLTRKFLTLKIFDSDFDPEKS